TAATPPPSPSPGVIPGCQSPAIDTSGNGALRLTNNSGNQSGFVIYNASLNETQGLEVVFDMFMYNGSGADGISFFIIDGSYAPTVAGANGGSLGYAQKSGTGCCDAPGLVGGFVGIGFDSYGNYSNPTEGRVGGPGQTPETVALRGASSTSYAYVTGYLSGGVAASLPFTMTNNGSTSRPTAVRVRVLLSTSNVLTVDMDPNGTGSTYQNVIPPTNLGAITGQPAFPPTFKFGWAASTGGANDIHEVRNFVSTNAPPYLTITKQHNGPFTKNVAASYTIQAGINNVGGNADQTIYVTDTIPANETFVSASGTGWTCNAVSPVQCTYPAPITSGTALPPITLNVIPTKNGNISNTACVYSADMYSSTGANYNVCSTDTVNVGASEPFMTIWKRITQIVRSYGNGSPQTITPTPDPGSSPGLNGTASTTGIDPGDLVTYTVYFSNNGSAKACGSASGGGTCSGGPDLQDLLSPNYVYQNATQTFTCCSNPASANSATFSSTLQGQGTLLDWLVANPISPASSSNAIEGTFSYQVKIP
ncbi:MAG TPA: hypothetical protein VGZ02_15185, partial [Candidatus Baltobacteraceae bacterium]|nr:hypothetical protein [Candidatus Baltobacteraceae bacterium]